jgi:hypothetical protein
VEGSVSGCVVWPFGLEGQVLRGDGTYRRLIDLVPVLCIWFALVEGFQVGLGRRGGEFRPLLILCDLKCCEKRSVGRARTREELRVRPL